MSNKVKDTDYLYLSAFLRAKEAKMLSAKTADRMLEAGTAENAVKLLAECGYGDLSISGADDLEKKLSVRRAEMMKELSFLAPDKNIVDAFRIPYDYHNAKVLIKAEASGTDGTPLLSESGRIPAEKLTELYQQENYSALPATFAAALRESRDVLSKTRDPQMADALLDKAYFRELTETAEKSGSEFLRGYASLAAGNANLKITVRSMRMKGDEKRLAAMLIPGGTVSEKRLLDAALHGTGLVQLYAGTPALEAAEKGDAAAKGGSLMVFEKKCDETLLAFLNRAKLDAFGEKVLISYISAMENELSSIRMILTGLRAGLAPDAIRERLRGLYV